MAFASTYWQLIGGGAPNAPRIWTYATADAVSTVKAANYFDDVADDLLANDLIIAVCVTGGTIEITSLQVQAIASHVTTTNNETQT